MRSSSPLRRTRPRRWRGLRSAEQAEPWRYVDGSPAPSGRRGVTSGGAAGTVARAWSVTPLGAWRRRHVLAERARSRSAKLDDVLSRLSLSVLVSSLALCACGAEAPTAMQGGDAGASGGVGASAGASGASLGGRAGVGGGVPCASELDCDDLVGCTVDTCDDGLCEHTPSHAVCQNGVVCDGDEVCDPSVGCRPGVPPSCDDKDACTIDVCDEPTAGCKHLPRDADQDGDPDGHCVGGTDCDDNDPTVSGLAAEICSNGKDDNCNGVVDEPDCVVPAHDTCKDPLILPGPGTYAMTTAGAKLDYGASCGPSNVTKSRDVVAAFTVPPGPNLRVDARVAVPIGTAAVALAGACGQPATELACGGSGPSKGTYVARARAWSVPPGTYPLYVYTDQDTTAQVTLTFSPEGAPPTAETCGTAAALAPGVATVAALVGTKPDLAMSCGGPGGDLFYRLDLDAPHDVRVFASSVDGDGTPSIALRAAPCEVDGSELSCGYGDPSAAFARAVGPGPVWIAVRSSPPDDVEILATLEPPSSPAADDGCATAPTLTPNVDLDVELADHTDDIKTCSGGKPDAAYALSLTALSDVLLALRSSPNDVAAVSLHKPACSGAKDMLGCVTQTSPMRLLSEGLAPGDYRVVVESGKGSPVRLTPLVRSAVAPVYVPFADDCASAFEIPPTGGTFVGNTSNATAKYAAGCDTTSSSPLGAPEQMLKLVLTAPKRVVFDMQGSGYPTLLDVRRGDVCPGVELPYSCTVGYYAQRSYLDLDLEAGTYWIQVDGYADASGAWRLAVFVVD